MKNKKVPMRLCIGCGELKMKSELVRIVKTAGDEICLDDTGKKNGRGAYICKNVECLSKAMKTRGLDRSYKSPVSKEVYEKLKEEMEVRYNGR